MVLFVATISHALVHPLGMEVVDRAELGCLVSSFLTLYTGTLLYNKSISPWVKEIVTVFVLAIQVFCFFEMALCLYRGIVGREQGDGVSGGGGKKTGGGGAKELASVNDDNDDDDGHIEIEMAVNPMGRDGSRAVSITSGSAIPLALSRGTRKSGMSRTNRRSKASPPKGRSFQTPL